MRDRWDGGPVAGDIAWRSAPSVRGLCPPVGMALGIALAAAWPVFWAWCAISAACMIGLMVIGLKRHGGWWPAFCWGLLAWVALSGAWFVVREHRVAHDHISQYLAEEPRLTRVAGIVEGPPKIAEPGRGAFGGFTYKNPDTFFGLRLERIAIADKTRDGGIRWEPASGLLMGKVEAADHRLRSGMRIEATGWAARFGTPVNPGERDYAQMMQRRGVDGRLTMVTTGNWDSVSDTHAGWRDHPSARFLAWWHTLRQDVSDAASASLAIGLSIHTDSAELVALLDRVLLGRWSEDLDELEEQFRRVGLAHLLAISGAHLGVLLGLAWLICRTLGLRPNRAALLVLVVLGLYLMAVPIKVPVARASIMALLLLGGFASGRGRGPEARLGAAAVLCLLWRPGDLFDPGFQLSFATVWALIRFTAPVSRWLMPEPELGVDRRWWHTPLRRTADALAVSIVAFFVATPIVAYHFQLVSPLSIGMSMAALPLFVALLSLGYIKALVGIALPSVSLLLAAPVAWLGGAMAWLVGWVHQLPMSSYDLAVQPGPAWVAAALTLGVALLGGRFARRRGAMIASGALLLGWGVVEQKPDAAAMVLGHDRPAIRMNSFSVGDGSCHLVRAGGHTLMFDCGSRTYPMIGRNSVVPGLRALGVARIDTLIISHPDLDHFAGVLDVQRQIDIGRVLIPPQVITDAEQNPKGTAAHLLAELRRRAVSIESITRGWRARHGRVDFAAHWPTPTFRHARDNETSVVLSITAGDARALLVGDIESTAMAALMESDDQLRADVMEVPHHGSFVETSPAFLAHVGPRLVIQSAGPRWAMSDDWPAVLRAQGVERLVTHEVGMVSVSLWDDGRMRVRTFLEPKAVE